MQPKNLADFTVIHKRRNLRPTRPPVPILIRSTLTSSTEYSWELEIGILTNTYNETLTPETGSGGGSLFLRETFSHIRNVVFRSKFRFVTLRPGSFRPFPLETALAIASRGTTPRKTKTIEENWEVTLLVR